MSTPNETVNQSFFFLFSFFFSCVCECCFMNEFRLYLTTLLYWLLSNNETCVGAMLRAANYRKCLLQYVFINPTHSPLVVPAKNKEPKRFINDMMNSCRFAFIHKTLLHTRTQGVLHSNDLFPEVALCDWNDSNNFGKYQMSFWFNMWAV